MKIGIIGAGHIGESSSRWVADQLGADVDAAKLVQLLNEATPRGER